MQEDKNMRAGGYGTYQGSVYGTASSSAQRQYSMSECDDQLLQIEPKVILRAGGHEAKHKEKEA